MTQNRKGWNTNYDSRWRDNEDENADILLTTGLTAAASFCLASFLPSVLVAPAASEILLWSSAVSATIAVFLRQPFPDNRLTYWDQCLMLFWLGLLAAQFVDPVAVASAIETAKDTTNPDSMTGFLPHE